MRKTLLFGLGLFSSFNLFAQDLSTNEAILFAQDNYSGTARYQAMGGAFGALGGDLTAISTNPAGSTVFANNQIGISITNSNINNNTTYLGNSFDTSKNNVTVGQLGGVFVFRDTTQTNDWKRLSIGITYESSNKFNNDVLAVGTNSQNNLGEYFASLASKSGFTLDDFIVRDNENFQDRYIYFGEGTGSQNFGYHSQLAFMGYNAYLLSPVNENNYGETNFVSNSSSNTSYQQEKSVLTSGESGKVTANIGLGYKDILSFGVNLNNHFAKYNRLINIVESNSNVTGNGYSYANYQTYISTIGNGFSFNVGLLANIKSLRLGASFQSSTWYTFTDEFYHRISYEAIDGSSSPNGEIDPNVTITLPSYKIQTPNKTTLSMAYIFGKRGLLSLDVSQKNYSKIKYKPTGEPDFRAINNQISQNLRNTMDVRAGGEFRIKNISLRGGFIFQESPNKNGIGVGNFYQGSGGLGINFGKASLNFAYSRSLQTYYDQILQEGIVDRYKTTAKSNFATCTVLIEM